MERTHHVIGDDGLQIPLPLIEQYGLRPGIQVIVEVRANEIRITPLMLTQTQLENRALRTLLKYLGDAVTVRAEQLPPTEPGAQPGEWRVHIFGRGIETPLGSLTYAHTGELISDLPTVLAELRTNADAYNSEWEG